LRQSQVTWREGRWKLGNLEIWGEYHRYNIIYIYIYTYVRMYIYILYIYTYTYVYIDIYIYHPGNSFCFLDGNNSCRISVGKKGILWVISWGYDEDNGDLTGGCRDENDVAHANVPAVHSIESPNIGMVCSLGVCTNDLFQIWSVDRYPNRIKSLGTNIGSQNIASFGARGGPFHRQGLRWLHFVQRLLGLAGEVGFRFGRYGDKTYLAMRWHEYFGR
jgi:hypothetical protein